MTKTLTRLVLMALLCASCAGEGGSPQATAAEGHTSVPGVTTPTADLPAVETPEPGLTPEERARFVLARWLEIPAESIGLVSAEALDWPDAGLGCRQPGLDYAPVVTPGMRFTFEAGGAAYAVHTDLEGRAVVCTAEGVPAVPVMPATPGLIDDGQPWMPAY